MKTTLTRTASKMFNSAVISKKGKPGLQALADRLPTLPDDPRSTLQIVSDHLRREGFTYRHAIASIDDVISSRSGSCLGLSLLVTSLLLCKGKVPSCKILVHPRDAVDRADQRLFASLMQGEYFDYARPVLPKISDQPSLEERINRFVPLCHPHVVYGGIPLETTTLDDNDALVEYPAEATSEHGLEILISYHYSDLAKALLDSLGMSATSSVARKFKRLIRKSLEIFPSNRDALTLQWKFARMFGLDEIECEAKRKLLDIAAADSDLSYKRWLVTGDSHFLDKTLEQYPEHIPAFLDRKVFLEKDPREARMNLAVALWCITYSCVFDLKVFLSDLQVKSKMRELKLQ